MGRKRPRRDPCTTAQEIDPTTPLKVWLERDGALLRLRLARPKANLIDAAMIAALVNAFTTHKDNPACSRRSSTTKGRISPSARASSTLPAQCERMLKSLHGLLGLMLEWPRPILMAVRGSASAAGSNSPPQARSSSPRPTGSSASRKSSSAFAPAASVLLPLRVGQARAEDLLLSGRSISALQAATWGLVHEVADDPAAAALTYFEKNLPGKSAAARAAVRAAREPFAELARARLDDVEALYLDKLMATRDANEGLQAFIEKRQPRWEHR